MHDDRIRAAAAADDDSYHNNASRIDPQAVWQAATPLRLIFWGGLLCLFDLTFTQTANGQGFKFDILNDALGALLIAIGVSRLRALPVSPRYASAMQFVLIVAFLSVLDAIREHFIVPLPEAASFALGVFSLVCLAAIVVFCRSMRWFCEEADLEEAARSWSMTTSLFVVIYALPLGLLYSAGLVAMITGNSFHYNLGPAGLLLLPVFAIPLIHLFVSTSRMIREAENYVPASVEAGSLPPLPNFRQPPPGTSTWLIVLLFGVLAFLLLACLGLSFHSRAPVRVSQPPADTCLTLRQSSRSS